MSIVIEMASFKCIGKRETTMKSTKKPVSVFVGDKGRERNRDREKERESERERERFKYKDVTNTGMQSLDVEKHLQSWREIEI